ncbi:MAG: hypothetical protein A3D74_04540 [Candidatus Levybacteria bacterium RIFCSPHIGHO2_02_FULL_37_13]|nr:MAG: hypothetical protein A3D74_04540 [Candidatus Levybacteria bacterium RIFCSPHIGHO2_02_FULL_37_13]OGH30376.1 MAG: hypothetical protein A3E40_01045 [Candidatus Levybacteria bacterium RIFCSPHIGHO2_12_FULL_37_9]OGH38119.1 MAG: hypothetical protein A3B41_01000 [Candidatus Levybacteria bacterium RIFCSPLOWO2_01_FULL_37_26]
MPYNKSIIYSFIHAFEGIFYALRDNQNLRIHFIVAFLVVFAGIFFGVNGFEMGIIGIMILLVITAEMINTAIEEMVNLIVSEHRQQAKIAKDVAAGMVLVAVGGSVVAGIFIFAPYVINLFGLG